MLNIAVLGSGRGSNFQAIAAAIKDGRIPNATVRVVISNNSAAGILEIARANGIAAVHMSDKQFATRHQFDDHLLASLGGHSVNFVLLAGYMKQVSSRIIDAYRNRIINIHPALLPKFGGKGMYGKHVHEAVIASREKVSGATVHIVDEEYDRGAIVLQKQIEVEPADTAETLAARVLQVEHEIYPEAVRMFASGEVMRPTLFHTMK